MVAVVGQTQHPVRQTDGGDPGLDARKTQPRPTRGPHDLPRSQPGRGQPWCHGSRAGPPQARVRLSGPPHTGAGREHDGQARGQPHQPPREASGTVGVQGRGSRPGRRIRPSSRAPAAGPGTGAAGEPGRASSATVPP